MSNQGKYIIKRGRRYHYQRRTPVGSKSILPEKFHRYIQLTLQTDSASIAELRAAQLTAFIDDYISTHSEGTKTESEAFEMALRDLKRSGFKHKSFSEIVTAIPLHEFVNRVGTAHVMSNTVTKKMTLGMTQKPSVRISDLMRIIEEDEKIKLSQKNPNELKTWQNPIKNPFVILFMSMETSR